MKKIDPNDYYLRLQLLKFYSVDTANTDQLPVLELINTPLTQEDKVDFCKYLIEFMGETRALASLRFFIVNGGVHTESMLEALSFWYRRKKRPTMFAGYGPNDFVTAGWVVIKN